MPRERKMLGAEGLLMHLRIAIVNSDQNLASDIAELCSYNVNQRVFYQYVGRVLLEHKYPAGAVLFEDIISRSTKRRTELDTIMKTKRCVQVAVAAANLKTGQAPFEKAFIAYSKIKSEHLVEHKRENKISSDGTIGDYRNAHKSTLTVPTWWEEDDINNDIYKATLSQDKGDNFFCCETYTIDFFDSLRFSNDVALKQAWKSMLIHDEVRFEFKDYCIPPNETFVAKGSTTIKNSLKKNKTMIQRQEVLLGGDSKEKAKLLFPSTNETFQTYMESYIKENKLYFVTRMETVLSKMRTECRQLYSRLNQLNIDQVIYKSHFVKQEKSNWVVQLGIPDEAEPHKDAKKEYPKLHKLYTVSYPKLLVGSEPPPVPAYTVHGTVFVVPSVEQITMEKDNKRQVYVVTEKLDVAKLKWRIDLSENMVCLGLLQLLVVRYFMNIPTLLQDIGIGTRNDQKGVVVVNRGGKGKPNRMHDDIWHHLLYFKEQSSTYCKTRNGRKKTYNSIPGKCYYTNVIQRLKEYLRNYIDTEKSVFKQWGEVAYPDKFSDLYIKILETLKDQQPGEKRKRSDGLAADGVRGTIRGESSATI